MKSPETSADGFIETMSQTCTKCGKAAAVHPIVVEGWEEKSWPFFSHRIKYKIQRTTAGGHCSGCYRAFLAKRIFASVLAVAPVPLVLACSYKLEEAGSQFYGGPIALLIIYGVYFLSTARYTWSDKLLYGFWLRFKLTNKLPSGDIKFPVHWIHRVLRIALPVLIFLSFPEPETTQSFPSITDAQTSTQRATQGASPQGIIVDAFVDAILSGNQQQGRQMLVENPGLAVATDSRNVPIFLWAVKMDNVDFLESLIDKGADINVADEQYGLTALHWSGSGGHLASARFLLEKGVPVDIAAKDGRTPLHMAAYNIQYNMANFLVESGANINARATDGSTPLSYARKRGDSKIVSLLKQLGAVD